MTVLSSDSKIKAERLCCIFPGSVLEIQNKIKEVFEEEITILFKSEEMRKVFRYINVSKNGWLTPYPAQKIAQSVHWPIQEKEQNSQR